MSFESIFTLQSAGNNTATYAFTYRTEDLVLTDLNEQDWPLLPEGRLKSILSKVWSFTPEGPTEYEQFFAALAEEGFSVSASAQFVTGGIPSPFVALKSSVGPAIIGWPFSAMPDGTQGVLHVRLTHSIDK